MRTSKTLSVSMSPVQLKEVQRLAKKENRTLSELVREALRRYQQSRHQEHLGIDIELLAALRAVQEDARRKGLNTMSMKEINAEIRASRKKRQTEQKIRQPVK